MKILKKTSKGKSALVSITTGVIRYLTLLFFLVFVSVIDTAIATNWAYTESEAEQTTTSLTYVDAATLRFVADDGDYIVVAAFEFYGTSSLYQANARLLIEGVSEGVNTQNPNGTYRYSMGWIKKVTFTAGVRTIKIQFNTADASGSAKIRNIHLFAWKAPTFEYNATEAQQNVTTTEAALATLTFTPSSTQDYLILASVEDQPGSTSYSINLRLKVDGVDKNIIYSEAENTTDYRGNGIVLLQNLDTTSHTILITGQSESGTMYARRIRLAAIPLASLTHYSSADETETSTTSTSYADKLSYSPTISNAGDHIIFASSELTNGSGVYYYYNNLLIDSTQYHESIGREKDTTDYLSTFFLKKLTLSAASHTFKIQHETTNAGYPVYTKNARIAVLQLPQPPPTDRGPVEDSYINQASPTTNYGSSSALAISSYGTSNKRSLLRFDLSSIPAGSTINSATLCLYYYGRGTDPVGRTYRANRLTSGWIEAGWNGEAGVTWNNSDSTTAWGTAGGDFTATDSATTTVPSAFGWMSWTVTNIAQGWVNGSYPNNGFLIKDDTEGLASNYEADFYSQDYTTDRFFRPFIYIDYTPASEDPYWIHKSDDEESTTTSTTYQNKLIHTFTPNQVGHWLVIVSFELITPEPIESQAGYQAKGRVQFDGSDIAEFLEKPDTVTTDKYLQRTYATHKIYENLAASAHTITIDYASQTSGYRVGIRKARIFATMLDAVSGYQYAYNTAEAEQANLSTTYTTIVTQTITPSSEGKYLIIASAETESDNYLSSTYTRLNIGGSYYGESIVPDTFSSYTDVHPYFHFAVVNLTGSTTFSLEAKSSSATYPYSDITRSRITAIRLDGVYTYSDTESRAESSTTGTSYLDKATLQFTPSSGNDYLVLAESLYKSSNNSYAQRHRVWYDKLKEMYEYTNNAGNYLTTSMIKNQYLDNTQHTIKIQYAYSGIGTCYIKDAAILAIRNPAIPTLVHLISFNAKQYGDHVKVEWRTGYEVDNLGFHVYREENGERVRLTPEPVAGSALLAGSRTALTAGHHYSWWDTSLSPQSSPSPQSSSLGTVKYWLKDIDLNGKETMHGPMVPVISHEPLPTKLRPELLSEIGMKLQEKYRDFWRIQDLRERLAQKRLEGRGAPLRRGLRIGNKVPLRIGPTGLEGRGFHRGSDPAANEVQRYLAGKSAVKILVKEEGWYRVFQPELVAAGLSSRVNPHFLQLYVEGKEQPIRVTGRSDGRFGPQDAIEFYGIGLDTPSTDTRVYWLVEGSRPGKRIQIFKGLGGQLATSSFPYAVEKKERIIYFPDLRNGDEDNFFGSVVYMNQVDQILEVRHLDRASSEDALLEVVLQGATTGPHRVKVLLNEKEVGELVFEGQTRGLVRLPISQSELEEGENLVSLEAQGGEMDVSLVDTIRLTYWHTYTADDNALRFMAQGGGQVSIDGFSNPGIRVLDITDPNAVLEVVGKVRSQEGGYTITFRVPGQEQKTLLALTEGNTKGPSGIVANHPSSWHEGRSGYDLVIIAHRDFLGSLQPLKNLRESQGLRVALVNLEDIYDEFSFGTKDPKAIKDFLTFAKTKWRESPRFVLLVGDASFDPRNYYGYGDLDFVPTKLVDTAQLETASDDWFVDLNNDGLPEIAIGRLPVQTVEEASIVVSKIVGYEKSARMNEALLVADINDGFNFEGASEEVRALLPAYIKARKIFRSNFSSDAQVKEELLSDINLGPLLVNFIGHGSVEIWRGEILTSDDAEGLINGMRLPFFVSMTCLNGFFQAPYADSMAEALLKAKGGGAVAVWASSGLTEPDKQAVMNKELIRLLFNGERLPLGEATARAKAAVGDQDVRRTWILFGDPTTRLTR